MLERSARLPRSEIDQAAIGLLARHSAQILAIARRYAANADDAEDAYQRGLEILLTKAPTTREEELVPWLKTVVKHEAFALRRQAERLTPVTGDGEPVERGTGSAATFEQAERYERLRQGAEALRRLKPQEIRCLVLKAQGLSYREICTATGFTYTKVNRCLTEGRQALAVRLAGIEGGIECARLAPLLSALADGEATPEQLAVLRPHMRSCLACRAQLREFRAAPARVAALVPAGLLLASDAERGGLRGLVESALGAVQGKAESAAGAAQQKAEGFLGATQQKAAVLSERAHTAAELLTTQKVAAVAASAAAMAGGGTAVDQLADNRGPPRPPAAATQAPAPTSGTPDAPAAPTPSPMPAVPEQQATTETAPAPAEAPQPSPQPDPADEFEAGASDSAQAAAAAQPPAPRTVEGSTRPDPGPRPAAAAGPGDGEFAP